MWINSISITFQKTQRGLGRAPVETVCSVSAAVPGVSQQTFPAAVCQHPICAPFRKPFSSAERNLVNDFLYLVASVSFRIFQKWMSCVFSVLALKLKFRKSVDEILFVPFHVRCFCADGALQREFACSPLGARTHPGMFWCQTSWTQTRTFRCASQPRKEGALAAAAHSHLLHTHSGQTGHRVPLFHPLAGSVFSCLEVTPVPVAASASTAVTTVGPVLGNTQELLSSEMVQFYFSAMLWWPVYFSSTMIKQEFVPSARFSGVLTMLMAQNGPAACRLQRPDPLCDAFIFHRPSAATGRPVGDCS